MQLSSLFILSVSSGLASAANTGFSGVIATKDGGLGGTVTVINDTALSVSHYTLKDASAPALYWWGATTSDLPKGFRINNERVDKPASTDSIVISLDAGHKASDFDYVGLWCEKLNANFGQAQLVKDGASSSATGSSAKSSDKPGAAAGLDVGKVAVVAVVNFLVFAAFLN